jgi:glycyl-tRNA synthetase alpha subunit
MALIWLSEVLSEVCYGINFLVMFFKLETSNTNDFKKIRYQTHCCQKLSYFDVYVTNTWVADGKCETSLYSPVTFKHLSHSGTKACISVLKKSMLSVCSQKETAWFTVASVANC